MFRFITVSTLIAQAASAADSGPSLSKEEAPAHGRATLLSVQPFSLLSQSATVGAETALSDNLSWVVDASVTFRNTSTKTDWPGSQFQSEYTERTRGFGVSSGLNFFIVGRAPAGLWLGPRVDFQYRRISSRVDEIPVTTPDFVVEEGERPIRFDYSVGGSFFVGYNAVFDNGFTVKLGMGVGGAQEWNKNQIVGVSLGPDGISYALSSTTQLSFTARGLFALGWSV